MRADAVTNAEPDPDADSGAYACSDIQANAGTDALANSHANGRAHSCTLAIADASADPTDPKSDTHTYN